MPLDTDLCWKKECEKYFSILEKAPSLLSLPLVPPPAQNCQSNFLIKCSSDHISLLLTPISPQFLQGKVWTSLPFTYKVSCGKMTRGFGIGCTWPQMVCQPRCNLSHFLFPNWYNGVTNSVRLLERSYKIPNIKKPGPNKCSISMSALSFIFPSSSSHTYLFRFLPPTWCASPSCLPMDFICDFLMKPHSPTPL